ncbi:hypothetical protein CMO90_02700 [Candidatus Woesearchaeota archaeon]|jgi:hypothetical protein|nr:hypothetical protein [Candidatus Woesearchaeota archaeon]|tara:strand:- start:880 stop:1539 length:660 start_codon:yes stop_codon:yes gene_type:complete
MTGMSLMDVLGTLWEQFIYVLPGLIGAVILLLIGYFIGALFEAIIKGALQKAGLDHWVEKHEKHHALGHLSVSAILGAATKWYVFVLFLVPAAALISLGPLSEAMEVNWLYTLALWLPNLIVGVLIFYAGLILANMAETNIESHKFKWAHFWGGFARVVIILFVLDIALKQIGVNIIIAEATYLIILTGLVLAFAIAAGIGFGDALKGEAKKMLKKLSK